MKQIGVLIFPNNISANSFVRNSRLFLLLIVAGYSLLLPSPVSPSPLYHFLPSEKTTGLLGTDTLFLVESQHALSDQAVFVEELRRVGKNKRELYARYLPLIGVKGILAGIHSVWPICHSEAHDLGKVNFAFVRSLHRSVALCSGACHAGCLHGVLMEAFRHLKDPSGKDFDLSALKKVSVNLCDKDPNLLTTHSPGNCYHGVGHGLMAAADYEISKALQGCKVFDEVHRMYYCATGAFMEYVTEHDSKDAVSKDLLYPCTEQAFPAACARYKMVHVARRHYRMGKTTEALQQECRKFKGAVRLGCFHGLTCPASLPGIFGCLKSVLV